MTRLSDLGILAKFMEALAEWNCDGFIQWNRRSAEWVRKNLDGVSQKAIGQAMYEHALSGGEIDQARENYEGYRDRHPYHYDFRISFADRRLYIETVIDDSRMGPTVSIKNIKDA